MWIFFPSRNLSNEFTEKEKNNRLITLKRSVRYYDYIWTGKKSERIQTVYTIHNFNENH